MDLFESIKHHFTESIQAKITCADTLIDEITQASEQLTQCLLEGHKFLACGNGGSACNALHFTHNMLNRFEAERPSLPALALSADTATLSAIANDENYDQVFSKQIKAFGHAGDSLLLFSTSGNSANCLQALDAANSREMNVIAFTGGDGGELATRLNPNHTEIRAPSDSTPHIQQCHLVIIHCLCDIIDKQLFQNEG
ncbi:MAG: SIS domain-containing protein [Coxiellaceae bacterium]|nr:SIS domain-containing protein [Coxiellaceae bacterium]